MIRQILEAVDTHYETLSSWLESRGWNKVNEERRTDDGIVFLVSVFSGPWQGMTVELWQQIIWRGGQEQGPESPLAKVGVVVDRYYARGEDATLPLDPDTLEEPAYTWASTTRSGLYHAIRRMERWHDLKLVRKS